MRWTNRSRRRFVVGATVSAAGLAGCTGSETADDERPGDNPSRRETERLAVAESGSTPESSQSPETATGEA
jgi:hypothetical protein